MDSALAVVEAKDATKQLVAEAGELAAGVDAELVLLHVTTEEKFQSNQNALNRVAGLDADYGVGSAVAGAERFAEEIAQEILGEDVEYTTVGEIGDPEDVILRTADREEIDHIFIHGKQRTPTGKAVFGDLAQAVILDFDGLVTVRTGGDEE